MKIVRVSSTENKKKRPKNWNARRHEAADRTGDSGEHRR